MNCLHRFTRYLDSSLPDSTCIQASVVTTSACTRNHVVASHLQLHFLSLCERNGKGSGLAYILMIEGKPAWYHHESHAFNVAHTAARLYIATHTAHSHIALQLRLLAEVAERLR